MLFIPNKGILFSVPIAIARIFCWATVYFISPFVRRSKLEFAGVKKVLVINLKSIGDAIFMTPAIKALRENLPSAQIHVLTMPSSKEILIDSPYVDRIITTSVEHADTAGLSNILGLLRLLRKEKYDLTFDFTGEFFSSWLGFLSGARLRVGSRFRRKINNFLKLQGSGWLATHEGAADHIMYAPQYFLEQLRCLRMTAKDDTLMLTIKENESEFVRKFFSNNGITSNNVIVIFHPGAGWATKRWPGEKFARLADYLIEKNHLMIIFTGSEQDRDFIDLILEGMRHKAEAIVATSLTLGQFKALIAQCHLLICGDTAALHIAVALGTRSVSLFGPTSAQELAKSNDKHISLQSPSKCSPCNSFIRRGYKPKCPRDSSGECMEKISVEFVTEFVVKQLSALDSVRGIRRP